MRLVIFERSFREGFLPLHPSPAPHPDLEGGHERKRNRYNFIPGFSPALPAASAAATILQQGTFDGPVTPPALRTLCEALSRSCQDQVLGAYDFIPGLPGVMSPHTVTTPSFCPWAGGLESRFASPGPDEV